MSAQPEKRLARPSPALIVALLALFVALSGTAGAVVTAAVPLAKHALTADKAKVADTAKTAKKALVSENAKKLGGQTASQITSQPGPASTAAGLLVTKTGVWSLGPGSGANFTVMCDTGQKVVGGGWSDPGDWSQHYQSMPTGDGAGWTTNIWTYSMAPSAQTGSVYAVCMK